MGADDDLVVEDQEDTPKEDVPAQSKSIQANVGTHRFIAPDTCLSLR